MTEIQSNKLNDLLTWVLNRVKEPDRELVKGRSKLDQSSNILYPQYVLRWHGSYRPTLSAFASKPNSPLGFNSKHRLLGAGHQTSNLIIQSLPLPLFGRIQVLLLLPETGSSPQTPSRQEMPCWQWLLTLASPSPSFKKRWNILTRCVISKSARDLTECSIYHTFSNSVENRLLSFVFDKRNMSMFIMWSPEDLLHVYRFISLLFLCLSSVNTGINTKAVTA